MGTQLFEFVSAHGTVVVLATTVLAAIGIVQWRKARIVELDLALLEERFEQGMTVAAIETLLNAKAASRTRLLK